MRGARAENNNAFLESVFMHLICKPDEFNLPTQARDKYILGNCVERQGVVCFLHRAAAMRPVVQMVQLSEGIASDKMLARQCRRKLLV